MLCFAAKGEDQVCWETDANCVEQLVLLSGVDTRQREVNRRRV